MNSELFLIKLSGIIVRQILNIRAETVKQGCPEISEQLNGTIVPVPPLSISLKRTEDAKFRGSNLEYWQFLM